MLVKKPPLVFDPRDPFPLLDPTDWDLAQEKIHAANVDDWLKIPVQATEARIRQQEAPSSPLPQDLWSGHEPQVFLTPYTELRWILYRLQSADQPIPPTHLVDIGAGYGRLGLVLAKHAPNLRFTGFEILLPRIRAVEHLYDHKDRQFLHADVTADDFSPPIASHYFIYDFSSTQAIQALLEKLRNTASSHPICIIGRGRRIRDCIERQHPWLSTNRAPEHHSRLSFYWSI